MNQSLAIIVCVILFALSIFQLALSAGAPLGKFAWGGKVEVLPTKLRLASLVSVGLYIIFALFVLSKVNMIQWFGNQNVINTGVWIITVYLFVGIFMNGMSHSKYEKLVMTPVVFTLAIMFLVVARN